MIVAAHFGRKCGKPRIVLPARYFSSSGSIIGCDVSIHSIIAQRLKVALRCGGAFGRAIGGGGLLGGDDDHNDDEDDDGGGVVAGDGDDDDNDDDDDGGGDVAGDGDDEDDDDDDGGGNDNDDNSRWLLM